MRTVAVKVDNNVAIMSIFDDEIHIPDEIQKVFGTSWVAWTQVDPSTLPTKTRELDSLDIVNGQVVINQDKMSKLPLEGTPTSVPTWRLHAVIATKNPVLWTAINNAVEPNTEAWFAWNRAPEIPRNSPTMNLMARAFGLTSHQVDQLFIDASQLLG